MIDLRALILPALVSLVFAWLGTSKYGEGRRLWLICAGMIGVGLIIEMASWQRQSTGETPLHTHLLLATVPVVVATLVIQKLRGRRVERSVVIGAAVTAYVIATTAMFFTVFYP